MNTEYCKERWILGGCSGRMITTPNGYMGDGFIADVDTLANANRIVECVNACASLPMAPTDIARELDSLRAEITRLQKLSKLQYPTL